MWVNIWVLLGGAIFLYLLGVCIGYHRKKREIKREEWLDKLADTLIERGKRIDIIEKNDGSLRIRTWVGGEDIGEFYWCHYSRIPDALNRTGCFRSLSVNEAFKLRNILLRSSLVRHNDYRVIDKEIETRGLELLKKIEESK